MFKRSTFGAVLAFVLMLLGCPVHAQDIVDAEPAAGDVSEHYDPDGAVGGSVLVGLRLGELAEAINPDDIRLVRPPASSALFCVSAATQDGRYTATNPFKIADVSSSASFVRLKPFTKEQAVLSRYRPADFAVLGFSATSKDCAEKHAVNLPQVVGDYGKQPILVVLANAGARLASTELALVGDPKTVKGQCSAAGENARLRFDTICRVPVDLLEKATEAKLTIVFDDGFELDPHDYTILLPARAP